MTEPDGEKEIGPPAHLAGLAGMDLVRRTLEEARGAARVQGKDVGRGRSSPARRRVAGSTPAAVVRAGPGLAGPTAARGGESRPGAEPRLVGTRCRGFGLRPLVSRGRRADLGPRHADLAERGGAHGVRRIDGVGDAASNGAGATAGQDRGRRRRRGRDLAENRRPGGAVVAQRAVSHRGPRAPRHVRLGSGGRFPESRQDAAILVLKRLHAPRIEKLHRRRK